MLRYVLSMLPLKLSLTFSLLLDNHVNILQVMYESVMHSVHCCIHYCRHRDRWLDIEFIKNVFLNNHFNPAGNFFDKINEDGLE